MIAKTQSQWKYNYCLRNNIYSKIMGQRDRYLVPFFIYWDNGPVPVTHKPVSKRKEQILMPLEIVRNDITRMKVDAIVNAANTELKMGGGVCGAIFRAAGAEELQTACDEIGNCPVGNAVITDAFMLPAKYIIHTPGPIWQGVLRTRQSSYSPLIYNHWNLLISINANPSHFH